MLTAKHVGPGNIVLDGVTYVYVPGTAVQLDNGDGTYADLLMFQIYPEPPLPALSIASLPPLVGTELILVGRGRNRGPMTSWDPPGLPPNDFIDGYEWGPGTTMRWGTNTVAGLPFEIFYEPLNTYTMAFATNFTEPGPTQTAHEAQAAVGDSGGATFALNGTQWELAGIMFLIGTYMDQPGATALYGNETYSVDLSSYRDQILDVMAMPEPSRGLWPGAAVVAMLARRRRGLHLRRSFVSSSHHGAHDRRHR